MSRAGKSFERAIAYFLTSAGFKTSKEPHLVRLEGTIEPVGDLDILAIDPRSNERIAVTCKEWGNNTPSSKDFNHFIRLMDIEGIRHGIVAWTNVPSTVYSLITDAEKRGYHLAVIDSERYDELNEFMIDGETDRIGEYFRHKLHLTTIASGSHADFTANVEHPLISTARKLGLSTEGKTHQQISDEIVRTIQPEGERGYERRLGIFNHKKEKKDETTPVRGEDASEPYTGPLAMQLKRIAVAATSKCSEG